MKKLSIALFIMLGLHHILLAQELKHFKDKKDRYGYKNSEGKVVIEPQFQFAADFTEGLGGVQQNDRWGFVDATGKVVIPIQYDNVYTFSDGLAAVNTALPKEIWGGHLAVNGALLIRPVLWSSRSYTIKPAVSAKALHR